MKEALVQSKTPRMVMDALEHINAGVSMLRKLQMRGERDPAFRSGLQHLLDGTRDMNVYMDAVDAMGESASLPSFSEFVNEGHSIDSDVVRGAKTEADAVRIVKDYIDDPDGDMSALRGVKVVSADDGDELADIAQKNRYEDQYAVVAEIDGEWWYAYSVRV